jgi:hypothetical protein
MENAAARLQHPVAADQVCKLLERDLEPAEVLC